MFLAKHLGWSYNIVHLGWPLHQRMVAEVVPPYTGRHRRNTLWLTGFKHPFQRGTRNDYHDLSRGWDLNRRPPEGNPQASALDHSATRPRRLISFIPLFRHRTIGMCLCLELRARCTGLWNDAPTYLPFQFNGSTFHDKLIYCKLCARMLMSYLAFCLACALVQPLCIGMPGYKTDNLQTNYLP